MKLLHCIPNMSGGGAEHQLVLLAGAQRQLGHEVHVALCATGPRFPALRETGVAVHLLESRGTHDPSLLWRLVQLLARLRPQVVHSWLPQMDVATGLATRVTRTPWVLCERASEAAYRPRWKDRILRTSVARAADAIVANSAAGRDYWAARARSGCVLRTANNIVPLDDISATPAAAIGPDHDPFVVVVGRLVEQKNLFVLLDALRQAFDGAAGRALFCGDGPLRPALAARIAHLGLSNRVQLGGYRTDVLALMKSASAFVSISHFEGQPNTVLEAVACDCPVVISDIPEHREILDDSQALFVSSDDAMAVAEAIRSVLASPHGARERALRAKPVAHARSAEATASAYDQLYRDLRVLPPSR